MDEAGKEKRESVRLSSRDRERLAFLSAEIEMSRATLARVLLCFGLRHVDEAMREHGRRAMDKARQRKYDRTGLTQPRRRICGIRCITTSE